MVAIPNSFVRLFMAPTESVLQIAPEIMRVYGLSYLFLPLNIFATYYFQSIMKPNTALMVSLARGIVLCGLFVYILPAIFGSAIIWWVMPITEFLVALYVAFSMRCN